MSAANYGGTYEAFLRLLLLVNANPYHKKKWDQVRRQWAEQGMYVFYIYVFYIYTIDIFTFLVRNILNPPQANPIELSVCLD